MSKIEELEPRLNVELIKTQMARLELTPQALASAIGVEVRSVRRWLQGDVPKAVALARLAVLFTTDDAPVYVEDPSDRRRSLLAYDRPRLRTRGARPAAAPAPA